MITAGIFAIIGGILCAKKIDLWTEFVGDSSQSVISKVVNLFREKFKATKLQKRLQSVADQYLTPYEGTCFDGKIAVSTYREILQAMKKKIDEECNDRKSFLHKNKKLDSTLLTEWNTINVFDEHALQQLEAYQRLSDEQKAKFLELLEECKKINEEAIILEANPVDQILYTSYMSGIEEIKELIQNYFVRINCDGEISCATVEQAVLSQSPFKYVLNACPGCGYDGPMIYVDDKANTMHCAACGCTYQALEYAEPELWEKCKGRFDEIEPLIKELWKNQNENEKKREKAEEKLTKLLGDSSKTIIGLINSESAKSKEQLAQILNQLKEGFESVVTQQELESALNGQREQLKSDIEQAEKKSEQCFKTYMGQISEQLKKNSDAILDAIETVNQSNKRYNVYLAQKLDSLNRQIGELFDYAKKQFGDLQDKDDLILRYIKSLCTKEEYQDRLNAMGADLKSAIMVGMGDIRGEVALTRTSMAQIISSIDDLRKQVAINGDGSFDEGELEKIINAECSQINGQISGIKTLIENSTAENRANFKAIIESQEEIKAILLSKIGLTVTKQHDFERLYNGKLPDELLVNDGLGGEFKCPYCGAVMERKINDSQYCRCQICGQKYIPLAAFCELDKMNPAYTPTSSIQKKAILQMLEKKYSRDVVIDKYILTQDKIDKWKQSHTVGIALQSEDGTKKEGYYNLINIPDIVSKDGIIVLPSIDMEGNKITSIKYLNFTLKRNYQKESNIKTILIGGNITEIIKTNSVELDKLKYIIIDRENDSIDRENDSIKFGPAAFKEFRSGLGFSTHILGDSNLLDWELKDN